MRTIFLITIIGFLSGIFVGFGGYFLGGGRVGDAVAVVNGTKIPYKRYSTLFNRAMDGLRDENSEITDNLIEQKRNEVIRDLIQEEVFYQEAKKYGIGVLDEEVAMDINRFPAFQRDGKFDQRLYFQILAWQLRMTPHEFEESRRKQIAISKLRSLVASSVKITNDELIMEYARQNQGATKDFDEEKEEFYGKIQEEKTIAVFDEWYKSIQNSLKARIYTERFR
jgi:peptidyl-prolyl cis-trans isomerase D